MASLVNNLSAQVVAGAAPRFRRAVGSIMHELFAVQPGPSISGNSAEGAEGFNR
jgi:hypothetical protein